MAAVRSQDGCLRAEANVASPFSEREHPLQQPMRRSAALIASGWWQNAPEGAGDYQESVEAKRKADAIVSVLYPNDATRGGKLLRLEQQYFFVSASLQDVLARFKAKHGTNWELLPEKAMFQLNDTHPTIAVAELMRLLVDEEKVPWDTAKSITIKSLAFTNHTVMPEALERWPFLVMQQLLPRHTQIIERLDLEWCVDPACATA
jgi:glycogen phosphorylase